MIAKDQTLGIHLVIATPDHFFKLGGLIQVFKKVSKQVVWRPPFSRDISELNNCLPISRTREVWNLQPYAPKSYTRPEGTSTSRGEISSMFSRRSAGTDG